MNSKILGVLGGILAFSSQAMAIDLTQLPAGLSFCAQGKQGGRDVVVRIYREGSATDPGAFQVKLEVERKHNPIQYKAFPDCHANGDGSLSCGLECDRGEFELKPLPNSEHVQLTAQSGMHFTTWTAFLSCSFNGSVDFSGKDQEVNVELTPVACWK